MNAELVVRIASTFRNVTDVQSGTADLTNAVTFEADGRYVGKNLL